MSDVALVRINNRLFSRRSCRFRINTSPFEGVRTTSYSDKRERAIVPSARKDGLPLGFTAGEYSTDDATIVFEKTYFQIFLTMLSGLGRGSYGNAIFDYFVEYSDVDAQLKGVPPVVDSLISCAVTGVKDDVPLGPEALGVEVTFKYLQLLRNGQALWDVSAI